MLAVFCLRLALGMLLSLAFLSPSKMHPRFFRTHLVTVLGLSVVALVTGWVIPTDKETFDRDMGWCVSVRQGTLIAIVVLSLLGSLVWILERPPAGAALIG